MALDVAPLDSLGEGMRQHLDLAMGGDLATSHATVLVFLFDLAFVHIFVDVVRLNRIEWHSAKDAAQLLDPNDVGFLAA